MLASIETIEVVAKSLREHKVAVTVVDPVRISLKISRAGLT